jgi:serralysin
MDFFIFSTALSASRNVDEITDFEIGTDFIELSDGIFRSLAPGSLDADSFRIGTAAADKQDHIIYNSATGALLYDADGRGGVVAVKFAELDSGLGMTNMDFVIV